MELALIFKKKTFSLKVNFILKELVLIITSGVKCIQFKNHFGKNVKGAGFDITRQKCSNVP